MYDPDIYNKALFYAANAHNNQCYPATELPYLIHLMKVSSEVVLLMNNISDYDDNLLIQLALLHDTIEDTAVTFDDLYTNFSLKVAQGVLALTKNNYLPKLNRMQDSLIRISKSYPEVRLVKMADRISNLDKPPAYWDNSKIINYYEEAQMVYTCLHGLSDYLDNRLSTKIEAYKKFIL